MFLLLYYCYCIIISFIDHESVKNICFVSSVTCLKFKEKQSRWCHTDVIQVISAHGGVSLRGSNESYSAESPADFQNKTSRCKLQVVVAAPKGNNLRKNKSEQVNKLINIVAGYFGNIFTTITNIAKQNSSNQPKSR